MPGPGLIRCSTQEVCAPGFSGVDCKACALGRAGPACADPADISRQPLFANDWQHLFGVVRASATPGTPLFLLGQVAHQAAISDRHLADFNTNTSGYPYRNIHASFWFFHWHRGYLLAIEQAARAAGLAPQRWGVPFWNITAPDAAAVAERLLRRYAPERRLNRSWEYTGPSEAELVQVGLGTLVGQELLTALHARPHEWFRQSGAQPVGTTNLDNPLFLPLHSYLDALFERWLEAHAPRADGAHALPAECARVVEPLGLDCGVHCAGGAAGQRAHLEHAPADCLQFLPLWGVRQADACRPLRAWGVRYTHHARHAEHAPAEVEGGGERDGDGGSHWRHRVQQWLAHPKR